MKDSPKKVLIISYYWPPAGGPGVQRWLKFAKYLPEFGWKPIIYTPENPSYPLVDESLLKDIPEGIEIIKTKIWEPYQIAEKLNRSNKKFKGGQFDVGQNQNWKSRLSIWIRGNFFIPDARVFWVQPSVRFLKKYLSENPVDALVTTGPPHSMHLIGLELKKHFPKLKWIADFRDPWTEISYYQHLKLTKKSDRKHRALEAQVFKTADITLATSYTDAENFQKKGAHAVCITNGFDESDSADIRENAGVPSSIPEETTFSLSYIGVLEQLRNPEILWEILGEISDENPEFRKDFELKLVGRVDDKIVNQLANSSFRDNIRNLGYLPHDASVKEMKSASVLLMTNFPQENSRGIIPGKIFEYLATGNPILSFGPEDADVAKILTETHSGKHFTYLEKMPAKEFIMENYRRWKAGKLRGDRKNIAAFSRKNLTAKLAEIL